MAYAKTKALLMKHSVAIYDIMEIIETFADELEIEEPHAVNTINAARETADAIRDFEDE